MSLQGRSKRGIALYFDAFVLSCRKYRLHRIASNVERHHAAVSELEPIIAGGTMKRKKVVPVKKQRPKARPKSDKGKGAEELPMPLLTPATET
jgi:hypothetical protein